MFFLKYALLIAVTFATKRKGNELDDNQDNKRQKLTIWDNYPIQPTRDITDFICSKVPISLVVQDPVVSDHNENFTCELIETGAEKKDKIRRLCSDVSAFGNDFHFDKADDLISALLDPLWSILFPWQKAKALSIAAELMKIGKDLFARLHSDYHLTQDEKTLMNLNSTAYRLLYSLLMIEQEIDNYSDILSKEAVDFLKVASTVLLEDKLGSKSAVIEHFPLLSDKFERNIAAAFMIKYVLTDCSSSSPSLQLRNYRSTSLISELPFWSNMRSHAGLVDYIVSPFQMYKTTDTVIEEYQKFLLDLHLEHCFEVYNLNSDEEAIIEPSYTMHPQFLYTVNLLSSTPFPVKYFSVKFKELFKRVVPLIQEKELLGNMADVIRILPPDFFKINKITKLSLENQQALSLQQVSVYDISCLSQLDLHNFSNLVKLRLLQSGTYLLAYRRNHGYQKTLTIINDFTPTAIHQCYVSTYEGYSYIKQFMDLLSSRTLSLIEISLNPWEAVSKLETSPETLGKMPETAEALRQFFLSYKDFYPKVSLNPIEGLEASKIVELYDFEELFHDVPRNIWMDFFGFVSNKVDITWKIPFDLALKLAFDPFFSCLVPWNRLEKSINLPDLRFAIRHLITKISQNKIPNTITIATSGNITSGGRIRSLIESGSSNLSSAWDIIATNGIFHSDGKSHYNVDMDLYSRLTQHDLQIRNSSTMISSYAFALHCAHTGERLMPRMQELESGFSIFWLFLEQHIRFNAISIKLLVHNNSDKALNQLVTEMLFTRLFNLLRQENTRNALETKMTEHGLLEFFRRCTRDWLSKYTIPNATAMILFDQSLIPWFRSSKITIESPKQNTPGIFVVRDMSEIVPALDDAFFSRHSFTFMILRTIRALRLDQVPFYRSNALSQLNWDNLEESVRAGLLANTHKMWDILVTAQVFNAENWKYITIEYLKATVKAMKPAIVGSFLKNLKAFPAKHQEEILKFSDTLKIEITDAFLSSRNVFPAEILDRFDNPNDFKALQNHWNANLMASIAAKVRNNSLPNIVKYISTFAFADKEKLKLVFEQDWGRPIFSDEEIASITIQQFEHVSEGFYSSTEETLVALFKNCRLYFHLMRDDVKSLAAAVLFFVASKYNVINESFDYEVFRAISNEDFEKISIESSDVSGFVVALNLHFMTPHQRSFIEDLALKDSPETLYHWLIQSLSAGFCLKFRPAMWKKIFEKYPIGKPAANKTLAEVEDETTAESEDEALAELDNVVVAKSDDEVMIGSEDEAFAESEDESIVDSDDEVIAESDSQTFDPLAEKSFVLFLGALAHNLGNFPAEMQREFMRLVKVDRKYLLGVLASPTNIPLDEEFWISLPQYMFDAVKVVFNQGHFKNVNWATIPSAHVNIEKYRPFMTKAQSNQLPECRKIRRWFRAISAVVARDEVNTGGLENED